MHVYFLYIKNILEKVSFEVNKHTMKISYRVWIEKNGVPVFGKGVESLLVLIDETGSLHRAAEKLNMSYRAAWGRIRQYENRLGFELIEKGRHGRTGAKITDEGRVIMEKFKIIDSRIKNLFDEPDLKGLFV